MKLKMVEEIGFVLNDERFKILIKYRLFKTNSFKRSYKKQKLTDEEG